MALVLFHWATQLSTDPGAAAGRHRTARASGGFVAMTPDYVPAVAALAGSAIGGLTSGITAWLNQRSLARAGQLAHELSRRQELYAEFIVAASNELLGQLAVEAAPDAS